MCSPSSYIVRARVIPDPGYSGQVSTVPVTSTSARVAATPCYRCCPRVHIPLPLPLSARPGGPVPQNVSPCDACTRSPVCGGTSATSRHQPRFRSAVSAPCRLARPSGWSATGGLVEPDGGAKRRTRAAAGPAPPGRWRRPGPSPDRAPARCTITTPALRYGHCGRFTWRTHRRLRVLGRSVNGWLRAGCGAVGATNLIGGRL